MIFALSRIAIASVEDLTRLVPNFAGTAFFAADPEGPR
jgi:hypothetical protein